MSKAIRLALLSGILFAAGAEAGAAPSFVIPERLKKAEKDLLSEIKAGADNGIRVPDQDAPAFVTLLKAGWLETNNDTRQVVDGRTSIVARLSESGKAKAENLRGPRDPNAINTRPPADYVPEVEDFDITKIPTTQRRVAATYPFEKLTAVGKSLFYPAPADFPADKDFAATKQGTVGGFNRKAKEAHEAVPAAERPPGAVPATIKAINDTKDGVKGVRFVRMT